MSDPFITVAYGVSGWRAYKKQDSEIIDISPTRYRLRRWFYADELGRAWAHREGLQFVPGDYTGIGEGNEA